MHTMAEDKIDNALEVKEETVECKSEDWVCHSQAIAATMSNRMEELGMTQRALAEKMNCTQQYVSKVLKGRENLSLETLCKIEKQSHQARIILPHQSPTNPKFRIKK